MEHVIAIIGGYLLGSIPFGLILTRLGGYGDIRDIGSGNIGATNVLRTGNKKLALATLVLDGLKGAAAVLLMGLFMKSYGATFPMDCTTDCPPALNEYIAQYFIYLAGLFALLGHIFPVWLKFKGGKGVATALGILLAINPILGIAACGIWLLTAVVTRYSSLSALIALATIPAIAYYFYKDVELTTLLVLIALLVIIKHKANIQRLLKGEEPKIGQKK